MFNKNPLLLSITIGMLVLLFSCGDTTQNNESATNNSRIAKEIHKPIPPAQQKEVRNLEAASSELEKSIKNVQQNTKKTEKAIDELLKDF